MSPGSKEGRMDKNRGRSTGRGRNNKKRDMGRGEYFRAKTDKRGRNEDEAAVKRRRLDKGETELPVYATQFSKEDIEAEGRKPKKKVAVMIGYSGTGYHGMQLTHDQKTIEGDLFQAFVAAGAISKANADDPKKSSFVRCARTDKGVHAAGNVISLKLIVEDEDIVKRINDNLSPQIRVWGFERTNNGFSAYQLCDSRIYEYLIPTHSFLPPHPSSFLGQKIVEYANGKGDLEIVKGRQKEIEGFWEAIDEEVIKPILDTYDESTRAILVKALHPREGDLDDDEEMKPVKAAPELGSTSNDQPVIATDAKALTEDGSAPMADSATKSVIDNVAEIEETVEKASEDPAAAREEQVLGARTERKEIDPRRDPVIVEATKALRNAYLAAKRAYRISPEQLKRVTDTFALYDGAHRFHNYTIGKNMRDPSALRFIKSFNVNQTPIIINGTEWLSLKVHGQSFMMHQIRKMVGMAALIVRCGTNPRLIEESYGPERLSIPKAPGLGLLLERPVFDSYNKRASNEFKKETIDFDKFEKEILEFKGREIYDRIHRVEAAENVFGNFFNHIDNFSSEAFLFVTSGGIAATEQPINPTSGTGKVKAADLEGLGLDAEGDEQAQEANTQEAEG